MKPVGYVVCTPTGTLGERGIAYTYALAGNGLWLEAENPLLRARILVAEASVRGLPALGPYLELRHGKVPCYLMELALSACAAMPDREVYVAIAWDGEYRVVVPPQEGSGGHVDYEVVPNTVVGVHSHGSMGAFFSSRDDADDQGFIVSVVLGDLRRLVPAGRSRVAVYGYFAPVDLHEVFAGPLAWVEEKNVRGREGF